MPSCRVSHDDPYAEAAVRRALGLAPFRDGKSRTGCAFLQEGPGGQRAGWPLVYPPFMRHSPAVHRDSKKPNEIKRTINFCLWLARTLTRRAFLCKVLPEAALAALGF
jgi:hypothetical protein